MQHLFLIHVSSTKYMHLVKVDLIVDSSDVSFNGLNRYSTLKQDFSLKSNICPKG